MRLITIPESKLYPLVYNPELARLLELGKRDIGLTEVMPTIDELEALSGTKNNPDSALIQSGILESLNEVVKKIDEDYKNVIYPKWTDDIVLNNKIREGISDYYKIRVYAQATEIVDHIDGLIQLDRYPKEMFGSYKMLRTLIQKLKEEPEKVRALMQLKIIAKSIIPIQLKYEKVEVIEPSIGGSNVMEGQ